MQLSLKQEQLESEGPPAHGQNRWEFPSLSTRTIALMKVP